MVASALRRSGAPMRARMAVAVIGCVTDTNTCSRRKLRNFRRTSRFVLLGNASRALGDLSLPCTLERDRTTGGKTEPRECIPKLFRSSDFGSSTNPLDEGVSIAASTASLLGFDVHPYIPGGIDISPWSTPQVTSTRGEESVSDESSALRRELTLGFNPFSSGRW